VGDRLSALFSQVLDSANLSLARKQVKVNKGAPVIEGKQGVPELGEIWIRLHYGDKPKSTGASNG
jgi:hypothetical protein